MSKGGSIQWKGNVAYLVTSKKNPVTGKREFDWRRLEAKTQKEAEKERAMINLAKERGEDIRPSKITLHDCYLRWIKHLQTRPKPAGRRTIEEYQRIYVNHIQDKLAGIPIQKLTAKDIRELIDSKTSQFTARRVYDVLNGIITLVLQDGDVGLRENVCKRLKPPKIEKVKHQTWNALQCKRFLRQAKYDRDYGVFLTLMTTGMRIGEVLGLTWDNVDLEKKIIYVNQKLEKKEIGNPEIILGPPKTQASMAPIPITKLLADELEKIKKRQELERPTYKEQYKDLNFVFTNTAGGPVILEDLRKRVFNKIIDKINSSEFVKKQLIEPLPKIRIHDLRHSAATLLLSMGFDIKTIQRYLRHADLSATQIYVHDDDAELLRQASEKMNEALKPMSYSQK